MAAPLCLLQESQIGLQSYNVSTIKVWKTNEKSKWMNEDLHISSERSPNSLIQLLKITLKFVIFLPLTQYLAETNKAETIKCACEPGHWGYKFTFILQSWDCSAF